MGFRNNSNIDIISTHVRREMIDGMRLSDGGGVEDVQGWRDIRANRAK